jgi:hypothetical protein
MKKIILKEEQLHLLNESVERIYYRGIIPGEEKRISTGNDFWDNNLFVSRDINFARCYGNQIIIYRAKPEAKICCEKSLKVRPRAGENMLEYCCRVLKKAISMGYDILEYSRQGDIGTIIINPESVEEIKKIKKG